MLSSRKLQSGGRARVHRRQNSSAPCPRGNGTTIGTSQDFTVLCNRNIDGDVLERLDAFDFTACVDLCSSFHPKCEGVSFDGSQCTLRANFRPQDQRFSIRSESAIGAFPGASSNCATLNGAQQALGTSFTTMCGFIIAGNDISQNFAPTFQDCLGQCAATSGCAAVSFDPSQDLGFKNCYLKTTPANPGDVAADRRTDSAMVAAAAAAPDPAATPAPANPGVSTIPLASTPPAGNGGVVFFTPPAGDSSSSSSSSTTLPAAPPDPSAAPTGPSTTLATDLASTPSSSSLPVGSSPFLFPSPSSGSIEPVSSAEAAAAAGDAPPSMAWVAAPVVGGLAAIALIAVSFVMLRRRRRGSGSGSGSGSASSTSPWLGRVAGWLPASWLASRPGGQGEGGGRRRVMAGMGNFSEVESGRRSVEVGRGSGGGGVRNSVVGFMTGRPMGMERLEDIEERAPSPVSTGEGGKRMTELRNSFNGLGQNKWSQ